MSQVFSSFQAPASITFFVPLSILLEAISTVASSMPHEIHLQYPGPDSSLLITWVNCAPAHACSLAQDILHSASMPSLTAMTEGALLLPVQHNRGCERSYFYLQLC